ncbi:MAG TPA: TIGR03618 family F420-dependent PPOX class oxidoreductase [Acidimicrobiia bacterium]|jgi:PPOX class probable F420-dependent enzyme
MTTLDDVMEHARPEHCLMVVSTARADGTIQSSLVNAGALAHPISGEQVLAFVTYGATKLRNLRARPQITLTARASWQWAAVEGTAEIIGPDDPHRGVDADQLRLLLRDIFTAAGGTHDNWNTYDAEMLAQHRTAVLVTPTRIYSNSA